jgi:hypothetical protein
MLHFQGRVANVPTKELQHLLLLQQEMQCQKLIAGLQHAKNLLKLFLIRKSIEQLNISFTATFGNKCN